ncbi:hypothetical protein [Leptospira stimsonii]|uniref:DUF349 domain-containing protein n=1 Tax=Leptospira stimsonii TaxID=2202203 RepID=A0A8B3CH76_9LEPT|nr:hypothetical protein [Leptospira stimsonii]RHX82924.1 hypothetical protein DLM78_23535 [Leptospira stimsonii]
MRESQRRKEALKLVNPKLSTKEEEKLFQERIETFWKAFQEMSSSEKRKEVNRLFSTFNKYQKRMKRLLFEWKDLFEKEQEIRKQLRTIGERMGGNRRV